MKTTLKKITFLTLLLAVNTKSFSQQNITDNESITSLIEKKRSYNKTHGSGYIIQLYNGVENRARNIKANFEKEFYWVNTKLKYEAPDWKIQVGNYKSKLDADRALNKIREKFSGAIIIEK